MKKLLFAAVFILGAAACGVGGAALGGLLFAGCGGEAANKPIVAPNENGANCLAERQILTSTCIQNFATRETIEKCIADAKLPNCATGAGIEAFVTSRRDGGTR